MSIDPSRYASSRKEAKARGDRFYFTGEPCPNGHIDLRRTSSYCCVSCAREWAANERATNPDFLHKQREICRVNNNRRYREDPEYRRRLIKNSEIREREKYKNEPEFRKLRQQYNKNYLARNPEARERIRESARRAGKRKRATPEGKAHEAWRTLVKRCVKRGWTKDETTRQSLGYDPEDLMRHLESQFEDGMTWDNYGEWTIDHIRPISSFPVDASPSEVNALSNLRPMWSSDNISKGAKWGG